MIKINKKVEYALMSLKYINDKEKLSVNEDTKVSAREICDALSIPFDTTAKVMQQMNNAKILDSYKGVKGGYYLKSDLKNVSFLSLAELIEEKKIGMDCESICCSLIQTCNIKGPIKRLNQYLMLFFKELSVYDLLSENLKSTHKLIDYIEEKHHEFN